MTAMSHFALLGNAPQPGADTYGQRAHILGRIQAAGLPVPPSVPVPLKVMAAPERVWGAPTTLLSLGTTDEPQRLHELALLAEGVDLDPQALSPQEMSARFVAATGYPVPKTRAAQLAFALRGVATDWNRLSARVLREANGAPADAGLGLVIQQQLEGGTGIVFGIDPESGDESFEGHFLGANGRDTPVGQLLPNLRHRLIESLNRVSRVIKDEPAIKFGLHEGALMFLDATPVRRGPRAELKVVAGLADKGVLSKAEALLRIDPRSLTHHLHPQIEPSAELLVLGRGIPASSGAAVGAVVFSAEAARAAQVKGKSVILVRQETAPEDIRGMHSAAGVVTLTGGITSHAAVIAQGLGLPCVVGANELRLSGERLVMPDGRRVREGEVITIDGSQGHIFDGALPLTGAEASESFLRIMSWADELRQIGVRANADTPAEARTAAGFAADGIGLCRTEHMFYAEERLDVMRQMILADDDAARRDAIERLLPMQRDDFASIFEIMIDRPVTIRLLDPPLHEFLPSAAADIKALAASMGLSEKAARRRIEALQEYNPMLGRRGVRLAITMPEIYAMQVRAIFEAATQVAQATGRPIKPQIMIPLVSAYREVELIEAEIKALGATMREDGQDVPPYSIGVMIETPRAALRAADLGRLTEFLSFGTNDLTQMTYGLSRDDAGRFMRQYVAAGVFSEDPFLTLDVEAVGELILTTVRRARGAKPGIEIGLCGEHGGDPASVRFCKLAGLDYVSCSPYRVPIARLAAAQASLLS